MRRMILLAAAITLIASSTSMAQYAGYIKNTKHNFADDGYLWADGQICKPCHTPHHAMDAAVSEDLWNHALSSAQYTLFDGTIADPGDLVTPDASQGMDKVSRLCLGCHDGTVALDSFGIDPVTGDPYAGTDTDGFLSTAGHQGVKNNLGQDFRNDHPVGKTAVYDIAGSSSMRAAVLGSRGYQITALSGVGKVNLQAEGADQVVGCKTCHNPHGAGAAGGGDPFPYLLRTDPEELCLTCHIK